MTKATMAGATTLPPQTEAQLPLSIGWKPPLKTSKNGHEGPINAIDLSPDGHAPAAELQIFIVPSDEPEAFLANSKWIASGSLHEGSIQSPLPLSVGGQWLALGFEDGIVRVWDLQTERIRNTLKGHQDSVNSIAFSPSHRTLASFSIDRTVRIWNLALGFCFRTFDGQDMVCSMAFSADSRLLALGRHFEGIVEIWDPATGLRRQILDGHDGPISTVAFSGDGQRLVTGSFDRTIQIWQQPPRSRRSQSRRPHAFSVILHSAGTIREG
ncbi:Vegetative incompatibility protein HET-E-1 [Tolypocladium ophioglossoides CBS 100239]|uniref:Mitochondrial division protein 1 n=1 Tax=Tolypocladium ophioglossoides (strain CBS 100239) TaxID=1163406 RepID=A0A0L0MZ51_TOLOC|nr:Vegetative incompatibility protein HET-E-1 [Tolypocladium ophioglossoides CBS 100239]